jgi:isoleucyl-tRNA synthetase
MIKPATKEIDFNRLEEQIQSWWKENRVYEKSKELLKDRPKYYFLDGPPYASGAIHLGTAWNKILKDSIVRYLIMKGFKVRRQAGWDCHGLPIEIKVEEKLGIKNKKEIEELGVEKFILECKKWAKDHIKVMTGQFQRLGVWLDWDSPYTTMVDEYIEAAWWTIKKAYEKGLLEKYLRVVTWCPRCETALADAEIEYEERTDPSIYVKFPVAGRKDEFILIWTTTPWTLIGNLAVMVHPDFEYVKAKTKEGNLILAKELVHILKEKFGLEYDILETMKGSELEGLRYENPLSDVIRVRPKSNNAYTVILADFVSLGEGTGCVHSAPGHGPEDFEACEPYGIEPICPIDEQGKFTEEAGEYRGLTTKKDDKIIINDLREKGVLLLSDTISHRYGHCWRCKTPIIYRATEQWFIKITQLKEKMLEEIERVEWVPEWAGSARFRDWIENAKDWTISRQRYWGIPLPIWICDNCGEIEVIGTKRELEERGGTTVKELHRPYVDEVKLECRCGGTMSRVPDVLDVWFDSGVASWASLGFPGSESEFREWYPVDFITEGHDQTRGWFYSMLGCGILAFDEIPYRRVLMHGFTLDEKGEKMSKSLGNVVLPEDVISKFGSEVLRFYVLWANKPWEDLRFNWDEVKVVQKMFNILWNVYVFATTYMSIDSFDPEKTDKANYKIEDKWILSRLNSLIKNVEEAFDSLHLYQATRSLNDFIVEDLSRWYITLVRPRTWIEKDDPIKLSAYRTLYEVLTKLSLIMAPISPHLSEEIYRNLCNKRESVHFESWPKYDISAIKPELEDHMKVARRFTEAVTAAREKKKIKRRWPLLRIVFSPSTEKAKTAIETLRELVKTQTNTHELQILELGEEFEEVIIKVEPNFETVGPEFKDKAGKISRELGKIDGRKVKSKIKEGLKLKIDGEDITLSERHLKFRKELPPNFVDYSFEFGTVYLDTRRTDEILSEGFAREVVRRIQEMRKEQDLDIEAFISANVQISDEKIIELVKRQSDYISRETRAKELNISDQLEHRGYTKEWKIDDFKFIISIYEIG